MLELGYWAKLNLKLAMGSSLEREKGKVKHRDVIRDVEQTRISFKNPSLKLKKITFVFLFYYLYLMSHFVQSKKCERNSCFDFLKIDLKINEQAVEKAT